MGHRHALAASLVADEPAAHRAIVFVLPQFRAGLGVESIGIAVHVAGKHESALGGSDTTQHRPTWWCCMPVRLRVPNPIAAKWASHRKVP
jgi:hypothetical protein